MRYEIYQPARQIYRSEGACDIFVKTSALNFILTITPVCIGISPPAREAIFPHIARLRSKRAICNISPERSEGDIFDTHKVLWFITPTTSKERTTVILRQVFQLNLTFYTTQSNSHSSTTKDSTQRDTTQLMATS